MAKFCGKGFLLLKGNEDGPPETFTQVGAMISTGLSIGKEQVDITTKDDSDFRQLLAACGTKTVSISLSGVFSDEVKLNEIQAEVLTGVHKKYQIVSDRGDAFEALFEIASFERAGEKPAAETYSITLESAGDVVYTPAP